MFTYTPKPYHAAITAIVLVILIAASYKAQGRILLALNIGALAFAIITAVILGLLILEALNERVRVMTEWMRTFAKLDDEGRAAVAFVFPTIRYRMRKGAVREMFEDTNVTTETFRLFLKTSNDRYISPRRDWQSADMPPAAWDEIKTWLQAKGYILQDSAAGNHSWLWKGNAYRHLMAYWLAGRSVADMSLDLETEQI